LQHIVQEPQVRPGTVRSSVSEIIDFLVFEDASPDAEDRKE
jgi:hypothetical protein